MFQAVKWNAGGSENSDQEPENCVSQPVLVGPSGGWVLGVATGWKVLEGRLELWPAITITPIFR